MKLPEFECTCIECAIDVDFAGTRALDKLAFIDISFDAFSEDGEFDITSFDRDYLVSLFRTVREDIAITRVHLKSLVKWQADVLAESKKQEG